MLLVFFGVLTACGEDSGPSGRARELADRQPASDGSSGGGQPPAILSEASAADAGLDTAWWNRKPAVRLLLTGGQDGKLKPCGCSAPQKGGLERAAAVLYRLREAGRGRGTAVGALSLGWALRGNLEAQEEAKADYLRAVRVALGYSAALLGTPDLLVPAMCQPRGAGPETPTPPLNVKLADTNPASGATRLLADFTVGRAAFRAMSVVEPSQAEPLVDAGFFAAVSSASQNMGGLLPNPDVVFVVSTRVRNAGTLDEIRNGLKRLGAGIVVDVSPSGHGKRTVDDYALKPHGEPLVVELAEFGTAVGVLDLDPAPAGGGWVVSYRQIELVPQWEKYGGPSLAAVRQLDGLYRAMVKGRRYLLDILRTRESGPTYVGSSACAACHQAIYNDWKRSPHAVALETLQNVNYHWDPECLRCHVVGWERSTDADWTVWSSGFRDPARTPFLGGVGCENCHGPGSAHAARPKERALFRLRAGSTPAGPNRRLPGRETCLRCHDAENSHGFAAGYEAQYLPAVDHRRVPADLKTVMPPDWKPPAGVGK